jgi:Trypsin-like peptidase domain
VKYSCNASRLVRAFTFAVLLLTPCISSTDVWGEPASGLSVDEIQSRVGRVLIGKKILSPGPAQFRHRGSGLLLNIDGKAVLLTAWHSIPSSIAQDERLFVSLIPLVPGLHPAELLYLDSLQDVAALRVPGLDQHARGLKEIDVVGVDDVAVGEPLVLVGFPGDRVQSQPTITYGEAAGVWCASSPPSRPLPAGPLACPSPSRRVLAVVGGGLTAGMSGGPALLRSSGKLVGVNHALGHSGAYEFGFVVDVTDPIRVIRRAVDLLSGG